MKNIGIVTNIGKDTNFEYTAELALWLKQLGCNPIISKKAGEVIDGISVSESEEMYRNADFVVVLGGDGTILRTARRVAKYNLPILGINFGTLGYLADVERTDAKKAIQAVLDNNFTIENRMMLKVTHLRDDIVQSEYIAFNEVCVLNAKSPHMVSTEMTINDDFINFFRADGIIVATPTGSTAYNLSAGGPILKPDTSLMAVTTVCAHNLYSRPFVINGEDCVKIKIMDDKDIIFSLDGEVSVNVCKNDIVAVTKSDMCVKIIKTSDISFYEKLRRKMIGG